MSWDQQAYSFGNPNAQPPTPTRTPTSGQFPSPVFHTPRNNSTVFEDHRSGWTPTFAEEYSVFNSTPGRLINSQHSFSDTATPRPIAYPQYQQPGGDISELGPHVNHFSPIPNLPLPPVNPESRLPSSPGLYPPQNRTDEANATVTPKKPGKRLDEAFSGQTATPPATRTKGSRKLAPKISKGTMQTNLQEGHYGPSQTPTHSSTMMSFTESSGDFFNYPMSAPATAGVYHNAKPFWDADSSMGGMELDFPIDDAGVFNGGNHRGGNSLDWGRSNQMFQETVNLAPAQPPTNEISVPKQRQRPLAPKLPVTSAEMPVSIPPFNFNNSPAMDDPFQMANMTGGVDPGLLVSRPTSKSAMSEPEYTRTSPTRPATSHIDSRPYQHQKRESMRDQEELRRSRGVREHSRNRRADRATVSSPIRSSRTSLQGVGDSRRQRSQEDRAVLSRSGRISPVKQRPSILTSIPELHPPRTRTEVKFTIDANGRARTETVVVEESRSRKGSLHGDDWDSSPYDSSSDDEPIIVPSRNSSFALPNGAKVSAFETSREDVRRHSLGAYSQSESSSQRSYRQKSLESEAETLLEDDGSGDATRELRKVMESRKKIQLKPHDLPHQRYGPGTFQRGSQYMTYGSSTSPTTITDPDGPTPSVSSSRSGTTRCVCSNPDSEGFMIQCESCDNWLHAKCVNIDRMSLPPVYICAFCAQTPNMRGGRIRENGAGRRPSQQQVVSSPLAHKSFKSFR